MAEITFDYSRCVKCGQCVRICPTGHLSMTDDGPRATSGRCMGCLQCAAVCPQDAVEDGGRRATVPEPMDELERLIMSRRSVRRYKPEAPDRKTIRWALDRAAYAPSGGNRRPTRWTVVYGPAQMEAVRAAALQYCRDSGYAPELPRLMEKGRDLLTCGASALIVGWEPGGALNPGTDTAIALATAELLLSSRGLGTCWGGYMRRIADRAPDLRTMLAIPEGAAVCGCLMVGRPAVDYCQIPARPAADIRWVD